MNQFRTTMRNLPLINAALMDALRENTQALVRELSRFDYSGFNRKSGDGGWSAGEVAEHLLLFDIRTEGVLSGKTVPVDRDPQDHVEAIAARLNDRENRIDAPAVLIPSGTAKEPGALIEKIRNQRNTILKLAEKMDLTMELPDTPHRLFGTLSGVEWINLTVYHTGRHLQQLALLLK